MQNAGKLIKSITQLQSKVALAQQELAAAEYTGSSGGGLVTLKLKGDGALSHLSITESAMEAGAETLAELIQAAHSSAVVLKETAVKEKMGGMTTGLAAAGFKLPGLM